MKTHLKRRDFIIKSSQAGFACCALMFASKLNVFGGFGETFKTDVPDLKKLNYCGYTCPDNCEFKMAGLQNDIEKKKEAFKLWRLEDKYGISFDPDLVFCNGCKTNEKLSIITKKCTVRKCAIEKGYDCCVQCDELSGCDKEIWKTFPDFHKMVINMREKYLEAPNP